MTIKEESMRDAIHILEAMRSRVSSSSPKRKNPRKIRMSMKHGSIVVEPPSHTSVSRSGSERVFCVVIVGFGSILVTVHVIIMLYMHMKLQALRSMMVKGNTASPVLTVG
ncbi:uncharacterized protein LY79DRAFT_573946 [Colletotrichum navitas]|uniref:Uncharacterized protein n=1 Tax=Colletotrichum navitas TaxID=681940 RepID=A0AAD8PIM6_9PEZI|nr:uncharacterized protein LY79DRAFT_573946 [Colletotrichum navitas]KAK1561712.1 hypothetical protein LY79DRAFT_573946 [Colletotrichum navitas]